MVSLSTGWGRGVELALGFAHEIVNIREKVGTKRSITTIERFQWKFPVNRGVKSTGIREIPVEGVGAKWLASDTTCVPQLSR